MNSELLSLRRKYFQRRVTRWESRGAGRAKRPVVELCARTPESWAAYARELRELSPKDYAIFRISQMHQSLLENLHLYCETVTDAKELVKNYKHKVAELRREYGVSYNDVAEFLKV